MGRAPGFRRRQEPPSGDEPGGPWGEPPKRRGGRSAPVTSLDEFLKRSRGRLGGGGPGGGFGFGGRPNGSLSAWAAIARCRAVAPVHHHASALPAEERGVVTRFGRYSHTLSPGIGLTLPSPIDRVQKVNVEEIRDVDIWVRPPKKR